MGKRKGQRCGKGSKKRRGKGNKNDFRRILRENRLVRLVCVHREMIGIGADKYRDAFSLLDGQNYYQPENVYALSLWMSREIFTCLELQMDLLFSLLAMPMPKKDRGRKHDIRRLFGGLPSEIQKELENVWDEGVARCEKMSEGAFWYSWSKDMADQDGQVKELYSWGDEHKSLKLRAMMGRMADKRRSFIHGVYDVKRLSAETPITVYSDYMPFVSLIDGITDVCVRIRAKNFGKGESDG